MNLSRRAFLGTAAGCFLARPAGAAPPARVATLEWTASETLLALNLVPIGAGDLPGYVDWVVEPAMPASVVDLGSRFEPNRELIWQQRPDLIVTSEGYGFTPADWEDIAPVHHLVPIAPAGIDAISHARSELERLATRVDRQAEAFEALARSDRDLEAAALTVVGHASRPVAVVSIFEERTARIYASGLVDAVMQRLGLTNAWTGGSGPWGFAHIGLERLATLPADTLMVVLDPVPPRIQTRLDNSSLWQNLQVVRSGERVHIAPVWPFGGLMAADRLARLLSKALATEGRV